MRLIPGASHPHDAAPASVYETCDPHFDVAGFIRIHFDSLGYIPVHTPLRLLIFGARTLPTPASEADEDTHKVVHKIGG